MANELTRQWLRAERAALARLQGKKRLDRILDASDPGRLVRSLPAQDLFLTVHEIGVADAGPLVQLASEEQFRTFVDLDAWKGDELDPEQTLLWLRLARGDDDEEYRKKLASLDIEVLDLLLRGLVEIWDTEEDGEPGDVEGTVERTPEGRFWLVFPEKGAEYAAVRALIYDLYAEDPFKAGRLLYAVRWELQSELSETALRWRNARLADLGFPSLQEALSLYARVSDRAPTPAQPGLIEEPPGFFLQSLESGSLLDRAMGLLVDDVRDSVQLQLVSVMNMALVADGIEIGDVDAVREHARIVRDTLALGLASSAGDDAVAASALLREVPLKRIFQIGFTRTLELKWRAEKLVEELPVRLGSHLLPDEPEGEALGALLLKRPRYFGGLDGPAAPPKVRPFATPFELQAASAALDRVEVVGKALAAEGLDLKTLDEKLPEGALVRWSDLFLTRAARALRGLSPTFEPLPSDELPEVARALFTAEGKLQPAFVEAAKLAEVPEAFVQAALARLEGELGPQVIAEGFEGIDARFAAPLLVR